MDAVQVNEDSYRDLLVMLSEAANAQSPLDAVCLITFTLQDIQKNHRLPQLEDMVRDWKLLYAQHQEKRS
ncbi:hypothetical protein IQ22_04100 [Pseudomonas duriflava]|uniref:Uncharacterized protein n=1 Tax=Pseudomonas duriflava TaxID=459528 RepID=A0A562PX25_9PSED|nr:hypothetical protein [Pseudomonas duriflava]TWI48967.1 hypothetical protein IQ22_04100 [Pseudomonas duriflava]